jgi:urease accessory protein
MNQPTSTATDPGIAAAAPAAAARCEIATAIAVVGRGPERSDVLRARGAGPLRLLCPRAAGGAGWIVTSSLGGGLVDGDALALEVMIEAGATCVVTSQASTKVYRGASRLGTRVQVRDGAIALVVPDPVVPFAGARFDQVTAIALDAGASLALSDVVTAGRVAYGERWSAARVATTLELAIGGERALLDRLVIEGGRAPRMGRFEALGTALLAGPRFAEIAAAELARLTASPIARGAPVVVAGSPLPRGGGALFRVAGERVEAVVGAVRDLLRAACARAGQDPWGRRW